MKQFEAFLKIIQIEDFRNKYESPECQKAHPKIVSGRQTLRQTRALAHFQYKKQETLIKISCLLYLMRKMGLEPTQAQ